MLKREASAAEICHAHQVSLVQAYRWRAPWDRQSRYPTGRDEILDLGKTEMEDQRRRNGGDPVLGKNRRLKELDGRFSGKER